jgi:Zn-dependent protease
MLDVLFASPIFFAIWAVSLVIAVTVHEFSHAWIADFLGDPTARLAGRKTLNPLSHLDPLGTLALFIAHIGWGKPVPVDPYNLENPKRDNMLISFAGPASNLLLATALSLAGKFLFPQLVFLLLPLITLNVGLAVFNLLPIPPLDGSKILFGLLPPHLADQYEDFTGQAGILLLLLFLIPFGGQSLAGLIILPIINRILSLLL